MPYTMSHLAALGTGLAAVRLNIHDIKQRWVHNHKSFTRFLGRRGMVLGLVGTMWLTYGIRIGTQPIVRAPVNPPLTDYAPAWLRGALWVTGGVLGLVYAMRRGPGKDRVGFVAIVLPPAIYAVSGLVSTLAGAATVLFGVHLFPVPPSPWGSFAIWACFAAVIRICAGWAEPQPLPVTTIRKG